MAGLVGGIRREGWVGSPASHWLGCFFSWVVERKLKDKKRTTGLDNEGCMLASSFCPQAPSD